MKLLPADSVQLEATLNHLTNESVSDDDTVVISCFLVIMDRLWLKVSSKI